MPSKYSHRVVLAHYSSLGLVDLPNDNELLEQAGLSYSAYASRSRVKSSSEKRIVPAKSQLCISSQHISPAQNAITKVPRNPTTVLQHAQERSDAGNVSLKLPQKATSGNPMSTVVKPKAARQRKASSRVYLSDEDGGEIGSSESHNDIRSQDDSSGHGFWNQKPVSSTPSCSNRHSITSSFKPEMSSESTIMMDRQSSQHLRGPSSNASGSRTTNDSIWSYSDQPDTPLTPPMRARSRSPQHSVISSPNSQTQRDNGYRFRSEYAATGQRESSQTIPPQNRQQLHSNPEVQPSPQPTSSRRQVNDNHFHPKTSHREQSRFLVAESGSAGQIAARRQWMNDGDQRLDSPTLSPEMATRTTRQNRASSTYQQVSGNTSRFSTNTQVFRPLPDELDFDGFDDCDHCEEDINISEQMQSSVSDSSHETQYREHEHRQQAFGQPQPKSLSKTPHDYQTYEKLQEPTPIQKPIANSPRSYSSYSSLSTLSDFIPSPLAPPHAFNKPRHPERAIPRNLNHSASVPSLANPNAVFSPSIFEGFEPRGGGGVDDQVPPLPRINLYSHPAARHTAETVSVSSNMLFPPDIPISRRKSGSPRVSARGALAATSTEPSSSDVDKPRDLAKAIAEAELKVKTLKQEAGKESFSRKSGNRLKKLLGRGKAMD